MAKAGDEIDAWCTKCRLDLLHRVVAAVASVPKRVECKTCHSQHNYRAPKGAAGGASSASKAHATKKPRASTKRSAVTDWQQAVAGKERSSFSPYSIGGRFTPQQLISHKKFGDGVVMALVEDQKINVLFQDGPRILIHNRG